LFFVLSGECYRDGMIVRHATSSDAEHVCQLALQLGYSSATEETARGAEAVSKSIALTIPLAQPALKSICHRRLPLEN
jgi:hypothetical protein